MTCPQCHQNNLIIQQAQDSHYREVFCFNCHFRQWLKNFNKKKTMTNDFNKITNLMELKDLAKQLALMVKEKSDDNELLSLADDIYLI